MVCLTNLKQQKIRVWKDYDRVDADTPAVIADPALPVPLLWESNQKRYEVDCHLLRQVHSPLRRIAASGLHPCRQVQACACESRSRLRDYNVILFQEPN
ncbi:MAG: hypothetical protein ACYSW7_02835 [Planctomycetota bacterium]|jgi:hypothetical protein